MARKPTDQVQLKLRFDERLRRHLEREAERNGRSMNAEIIARLERSMERVGLLEEVLALAYGGTLAKLMAGIHVHGGTSILKLTDQHKQQIMDAVLRNAKVQEG